MTTRTEAAQKAAYWAERAEAITAHIVKLGENLPNLEHSNAQGYRGEEAAALRARIAGQERVRAEAVQMAGMWVGVAETLSAGGALDAYAHQLAEKQRAAARERYEQHRQSYNASEIYRLEGSEASADLIDPEVQPTS